MSNDLKLRESNVIIRQEKIDEVGNDFGHVGNSISGCDVVQRCPAESPIDRNHLKECCAITWIPWLACQLTLNSPCWWYSCATNVLTRAVASPFQPWIVKRVGWLDTKCEFCNTSWFHVMICAAVGFRLVSKRKNVSVSGTKSGSTGASSCAMSIKSIFPSESGIKVHLCFGSLFDCCLIGDANATVNTTKIVIH